MMDGLLNHGRRVADEASRSRAATRHGTITSYDPDNYAIKVTLQPDDVLTGWIPLKACWIGNGWGMFAAPSIGDAVEIDFQEADGGVGSAGWRFFNDSERPLSVQAGEFWLVHKKGQSVKLTTDGALTIDDGQGASVKLNGDGTITSAASTWNHTGDINVTGDLAVSGDTNVDGDVVAGTVSLKHHLTQGVTAGSSLSGEPQP
jgi:hypothetical protein